MTLEALSPLDGRYEGKVKELKQFFSEEALIKYRVKVEIEYLLELHERGHLPSQLTEDEQVKLKEITESFDQKTALKIKSKEAEINHDVKAVEYFLKEFIVNNFGKNDLTEFVHFGLTSQDINNTAFPLMIKDAIGQVIIPYLEDFLKLLTEISNEWKSIPMLARTHGQPASPTSLGKEIQVFQARLEKQLMSLKKLKLEGKFGGATGNFNAHKLAFPEVNWNEFGNSFLKDRLGLIRQSPTTQIEHYDQLAALFDNLRRINTILIDFSRDIWHYISINYIKQKAIAGEVGSSAMPHKVNPIDFENAEGNLGIANALFEFLANKLPVSRLQRDLTDSTVLRNVGVPIAHSLLSYKALTKGMNKLSPDTHVISSDLNGNWMVLAEAIQTELRKIGYPKPYEALKDLTRGKSTIGKKELEEFIDGLGVQEEIKSKLKALRPDNYLGYSID